MVKNKICERDGVIFMGKNREQQSLFFLEKICLEYVIFLDASVAIDSNFLLFAQHIKEISKSYDKVRIFISKVEFEKIEKAANNGNKERAILAQAGMDKLISLSKEKLAYSLDSEITYAHVMDFLNKRNKVCLLTQEKSVVKEIIKNVVWKEFSAFLVRRVNRFGYLSPYKELEQFFRVECANRNVNQNLCREQSDYKLSVPNKVVEINNMSLFVRNIPVEGQFIYTEQGKEKIQLKELIDEVSDGKIYSIGGKLYAKVYDKNFLDVYHMQKCKLMITNQIDNDAICWPLRLIYNSDFKFIGYIFRAYTGKPLHEMVLKKAGLEQYFPNWQKVDLVQLSITIFEEIIHLHMQNILIGCLDLTSIRVVDSKTVFFTETDKYQIDGYPCLLRNMQFISPERLDYMDKIFLFSEKTENYLVAVLAFTLMMPGITPYTQQNSGNIRMNIKRMHFPYAFRENHSKGVPNGFWRFVWSHLYYDLKEAFYKTFQNGEERNSPEKRYSAEFWLDKLKKYKEALISGDYCKNDSYSALMFPDTFRKVKSATYIRCANCNKEYPIWFMDSEFKTICKKCRNKQSESFFDCVDCKRRFYYSIKEEMLHTVKNWKPQKHCDDCKKLVTCKKCGKEYFAYLLRNGRCKACDNKIKRNT